MILYVDLSLKEQTTSVLSKIVRNLEYVYRMLLGVSKTFYDFFLK